MAATRKRRIVLLMAGLALGGGVAALLMVNSVPAAAPLRFCILDYQRSEREIRARVSVTNLSEANILLFDGRGWAHTEGPNGWVTNALTSSGPLQSVAPGSNFVETVIIPAGTTRWNLGYFVPTKSPREKVRLAAGWRGHVLAVMKPMISDRKPPAQEYWSEIFVVPAGTNLDRPKH